MSSSRKWIGNLSFFKCCTDYYRISKNHQRNHIYLTIHKLVFCGWFGLQIYYQNVDFGGYYWGANNTKLWREQNGGKWRFLMYDMDGAMGYFGSTPYDNYINLTRNPFYPNVFSEIFDKTLDNLALRNYFVNRFADLLNTIYMPDNMESVMNEMRDSIIGEIPHQVNRWGAPDVATVDYYVSTVLDYNTTRHTASRNQINNSFDLDGQVTLTIDVEPAGAGYIKLNTIVPQDLPWNGIYFDGVPVTITAVANPGYSFSNWDNNDLIPTGSTEVALTINIDFSETFIAVFNGAPVIPEITVTELNYNSELGMNTGDWAELYNVGMVPVNLTNYIVTNDLEYENCFEELMNLVQK